MSGFRLILLESSVRGETFFGKVNFKRADWSEPFYFFPIIRHSQNILEPEQRLYLRLLFKGTHCQHSECASDQLSGVWGVGLGNFGRD